MRGWEEAVARRTVLVFALAFIANFPCEVHLAAPVLVMCAGKGDLSHVALQQGCRGSFFLMRDVATRDSVLLTPFGSVGRDVLTTVARDLISIKTRAALSTCNFCPEPRASISNSSSKPCPPASVGLRGELLPRRRPVRKWSPLRRLPNLPKACGVGTVRRGLGPLCLLQRRAEPRIP